MTQYYDFRLNFTPDLSSGGLWYVEIADSPLPIANTGPFPITPQVTEADLQRLRSPAGWPNIGDLQRIGDRVRSSLMNPVISAHFDACLNQVNRRANGEPRKVLRLVITVRGTESAPPPPAGIVRMEDLPVEVLNFPLGGNPTFIATQNITPISRNLRSRLDDTPPTVTPPLKILVVSATPLDRAPSDITTQKDAVLHELSELQARGLVEFEICEPPTRQRLHELLQAQSFHCVHFITHGAYDIVGTDPQSQPYLCLKNPNNDYTDAVGAEDLRMMLGNGGVQLAVITACASAQVSPALAALALAAPTEGTALSQLAQRALAQADATQLALALTALAQSDPALANLATKDKAQAVLAVAALTRHSYRALQSIAQALMTGVSPLAGVVAMQYDFEAQAAIAFSRGFYSELLDPQYGLDEVVTRARDRIAGMAGITSGHRAWSAPVVYWRRKGAKVFDIVSASSPQLTTETQATLIGIDKALESYCAVVNDIYSQPLAVQSLLVQQKNKYIGEIQTLLDERAQTLGSSIRLQSSTGNPGQSVQCQLAVKLTEATQIDEIEFDIPYPPGLKYDSYQVGADRNEAGINLTARTTGLHVLLRKILGNNQWPIGDLELLTLTFNIGADASTGIRRLDIANFQVQPAPTNKPFTAMGTVLFVEPPLPAPAQP